MGKHVFKLIYIIVLLLISNNYSIAQEKRALLIGIGDYPSGTGWNKIHGNNDVGLIHNTLINLGFKEKNITHLVDSEATYDNIMKAMQNLLSVCQKDDIAYIQFSGHGQRITDTNGDERKDGLDEAWIPYDAQRTYRKGIYEGEKHITDDFLNTYLTKLRFKVGYRGKIIVIADACYSGSGSRGLGDDEVYTRGTAKEFIIPDATPNVIRKEMPEDWLFVAACEDYQINYEYRDQDGNYYGSLSYSIASSGEKLTGTKYTTAIEIWKSMMKIIAEKQYINQDVVTDGRPSKTDNNLF